MERGCTLPPNHLVISCANSREERGKKTIIDKKGEKNLAEIQIITTTFYTE